MSSAHQATVFESDNVYSHITHTIGNTPLVSLNRIPKEEGISAQLLAKLEYFNPAGSIKDRAAMAMFEDLLENSHFPVKHVIEATSGNSGVACAWLGAIYDVPVTIVMPEHMSVERQQLIKHYGATLITTPKAQGMPGAIAFADTLIKSIPGSASMNQFANPANAQAHELTTAKELWDDTKGQLDVVVACMGTGGTLSGIGRYLKKRNPKIEIIAAEPLSCPLLSLGKAGEHTIQGINPGHIPEGLDREVVDRAIMINDQDAIQMARKLARKEGLAVGMSSGTVACAAIEVAKQPEYQHKKIVMIMADGAERYFSTTLFAEG